MSNLKGQLDMFGGELDGEEEYRSFTAKFDPANAPRTVRGAQRRQPAEALAGQILDGHGRDLLRCGVCMGSIAQIRGGRKGLWKC